MQASDEAASSLFDTFDADGSGSIELRELERQLDGGRAQEARAARDRAARAAPAPSEGHWGALRKSVHQGSSDGEMLNQIYLRRTLTMQIVL